MNFQAHIHTQIEKYLIIFIALYKPNDRITNNVM